MGRGDPVTDQSNRTSLTVRELNLRRSNPSRRSRGSGSRSWLVPQDCHAGGQTNARDRPRRRLTGRDGGVFDDVPRVRDCRRRDVEHLVCGHVLPCGENRGGFRGTGGEVQHTSEPNPAYQESQPLTRRRPRVPAGSVIPLIRTAVCYLTNASYRHTREG